MTNFKELVLGEKRAKTFGQGPPPPLIRAMPESKHYFFREVIPNLVSITAKNCRYNISGFVEELPQLPENRYGHACGALPTGVRPVP